jgi:hypothetical protein
MKMTIDLNGFKNAFANLGRIDNFSHSGLQALFNHLEDIEQVGGGEIELDVIAICCEFTEFDTALQAAHAFSALTIDQDLTEIEALQFLTDNTEVIRFDGGIIIQNF